MRSYLVSRSLRMVAVMVALIAATFFLSRIVADPVALTLPMDASPADRARVTHELGLDKPLPEQFVDYLGGLFRGDLGVSVWQRQPALSIVLERIPASIVLAVATLAVSVVIGLAIGVAGALRPGSLVDRVATLASATSVAVPDFWLGIMLVTLFAVQLGWVPTSGYGSLIQLILPVATLAMRPIGRLARVSREAVLEEMGKDYVTAARARGLSVMSIFRKHVFKAIVAVAITIAGYDFVYVFTGHAVGVETVFNWPGLGQLAVEATLRQDVILVSAIVLFSGLLVTLVNTLLDVVHAAIDRRVTL